MLVTGGSRGIGAAVARPSPAGYEIALTFATTAPPRKGRSRRERHRPAVGRRAADVAREEDVVAAFAAVDDAFGRLDALVVNAGITGRFTRVEDIDAATLERVLAVNVPVRSCARARRCGVCPPSAAARAARSCRLVARRRPRFAQRVRALRGIQSRRRHADPRAREGGRARGDSRQRGRAGAIDTEIHARGGRPERVARITPTMPMGRIGRPTK